MIVLHFYNSILGQLCGFYRNYITLRVLKVSSAKFCQAGNCCSALFCLADVGSQVPHTKFTTSPRLAQHLLNFHFGLLPDKGP